jgi:Spy/CpxP family protein refolding chaperone
MTTASPEPNAVDPGPRRPTSRRASSFAWRGSILTVVLAGLAAFLGAHLGSRQTQAPGMPLSERVFEVMNEGIPLTDDQKETIRQISARYAPTREKLRMQSRGLNVRLAHLMAEEQQFGPKTMASLEQLQLVMGKRLTLSMEFMLEVRAVLTPEQKAYFDRRVTEEAALSR